MPIVTCPLSSSRSHGFSTQARACSADKTPCCSTTRHGPMHVSKETPTMSLPFSTKCKGASICVPLCRQHCKAVTLQLSPSAIRCSGLRTGAGSPGYTGALSSSRVMSKISKPLASPHPVVQQPKCTIFSQNLQVLFLRERFYNGRCYRGNFCQRIMPV